MKSSITALESIHLVPTKTKQKADERRKIRVLVLLVRPIVVA